MGVYLRHLAWPILMGVYLRHLVWPILMGVYLRHLVWPILKNVKGGQGAVKRGGGQCAVKRGGGRGGERGAAIWSGERGAVIFALPGCSFLDIYSFLWGHAIFFPRQIPIYSIWTRLLTFYRDYKMVFFLKMEIFCGTFYIYKFKIAMTA